jgi:hypothetical protein
MDPGLVAAALGDGGDASVLARWASSSVGHRSTKTAVSLSRNQVRTWGK